MIALPFITLPFITLLLGIKMTVPLLCVYTVLSIAGVVMLGSNLLKLT